MLRDTRYSNEATRSTSSIQSNANHTLELAINYQPNVQPESFTESSQFPSQQYFPTHFDIQHHQMPPSYPEPLSIPDVPATGRKGAIRVGKRRKRVTEVEVPDNEWECVLCKVKAHMTPLKRRGEDGKRNICNACYVRNRVKKERSERGMSRPVLAMGPIPGYVTPMRSAPYSINNNSGYIIQPYVNGPIYKSVDMMNPMNAMNHMQMNGMNTSQGYDEQHQFIPQRPFWGGEYNDPYIGGQQQ